MFWGNPTWKQNAYTAANYRQILIKGATKRPDWKVVCLKCIMGKIAAFIFFHTSFTTCIHCANGITYRSSMFKIERKGNFWKKGWSSQAHKTSPAVFMSAIWHCYSLLICWKSYDLLREKKLQKLKFWFLWHFQANLAAIENHILHRLCMVTHMRLKIRNSWEHALTVQMHSPHDSMLQAARVYLSSKITVDDIEWSDSRRVDCVL